MKKRIFLLTFTLTITMFSHNGYTEPFVTDGLVSYWTFDQQDIADDTVKDVWGKNDGTIVGDPKLVTGQVNGALEFDGSNDYVNLTNLGDFGNQLGTSTFEAWVKTSFKNDWTTLFKVRDEDCGMSWGIDFNRTLKHRDPLDLFMWLKANPPPHRKPDDLLTSGKDFVMTFLGVRKLNIIGCSMSRSLHEFPISDGEWHHLIYIIKQPYVDENGKEWAERALFIDGALNRIVKRSSTHPNKYVPFFEPIYLGAGNNRGEAEAFFNGIIDEVRIYNRPLTEDEVTQNSQIGLSVEATKKLPVVWGTLKTTLK